MTIQTENLGYCIISAKGKERKQNSHKHLLALWREEKRGGVRARGRKGKGTRFRFKERDHLSFDFSVLFFGADRSDKQNWVEFKYKGYFGQFNL